MMNLTTAKKIMEDTDVILPLVHQRDMAHAVLGGAQRRARVSEVIAELKRLAHPRNGKAPIRLPPRRLRRAAARVIAKENRRLERERAHR